MLTTYEIDILKSLALYQAALRENICSSHADKDELEGLIELNKERIRHLEHTLLMEEDWEWIETLNSTSYIDLCHGRYPRLYNDVQKPVGEHFVDEGLQTFLKFIKGFPEPEERAWRKNVLTSIEDE